MTLLALLDQGPRYGLQLKQEFEAHTGDMWPLNVGQVYTTLGRLERDGLVVEIEPNNDAGDRQRIYGITEAGESALADWFAKPASDSLSRDELVLKVMFAAAHPGTDIAAVLQSERRGALALLQEYTHLKSDPPAPHDLGWLLLLDSLIFKVESRIRWLDAAEARIERHHAELRGTTQAVPMDTASLPSSERSPA